VATSGRASVCAPLHLQACPYCCCNLPLFPWSFHTPIPPKSRACAGRPELTWSGATVPSEAQRLPTPRPSVIGNQMGKLLAANRNGQGSSLGQGISGDNVVGGTNGGLTP
jgi:hypothetical protein